MKWAALPAALVAGQLAAATLEGFASLPADTLMPGPDSGHFIDAADGIPLPFGGQPVQGFSAIISSHDGSYLVLSDNGFGSRANSPDFLLRIYSIEPDFRTPVGGSGEMRINGFINLSDPNNHMPAGVTSSAESRPGKGRLAADLSPRLERLLTGADLDPESLQGTPDGTLWIGDEFGPYLAHLDAQGALIEPPFSLSGLVSESRQHRPDDAPSTLPVSRGFEGMAMSPSGKTLYPMLEGSLFEQPGQLNIYTFDLESRSFTNTSALEPSYRYRIEPAATAVGSFTMFSETAGLVLERDSGEAGDAQHKKIFRVDFNRIDSDGFLVKREIADLMNIADPHDLNDDGQALFTFPFQTPEVLLVMDKDTIGVINDNNYPFGRGRGEDAGPEPTEFILLAIDELW